jgi:protein arginine kinase
MNLSDLASQPGEWLRGTGPESDVIISSRIRLARNLVEFPFLTHATEAQRQMIVDKIRTALTEAGIIPDPIFLNIDDLSDVQRTLLVERHLISRELTEGEGPRAVVFGDGERISLMINEEDHLRMQVLRSGLELASAWQTLNGIDDKLEAGLAFAFSNRLGYLTACLTNVGTGLRASVMMHLPALVVTREIEKVFQAVTKVNLAVRGLYGEGTQASGDFYQISNQRTLGKSEGEIIENLEGIVPRIVDYEKMARDKLLSDNRAELEDRVWRAYGMLSSARTISSEETMHLLSSVRLGVNLGLIADTPIGTVNELFILALPAHLQVTQGSELDAAARNVTRADFIRTRLVKPD